MREINKIIIHCTATSPKMDIGVKEVRQWHLAQGWRDIGYHFLIRRNGVIEEGRPLEQVGSHCKGQNKNSIGVCYVGGIDEKGKAQDNRTREQQIALRELLYELGKTFPFATIHGHNEFSSKACPSFNVQEWLKEEWI